MHKVLIANRGEIAVRIARTAADLGIKTVAVYSSDDAASMHRQASDSARALGVEGAKVYLDIEHLLEIARQEDCDAIHPGYGFLSENATFATACHEAGICFIGPSVQALETFGDKSRARALALREQVPVAQGTQGATTLEQATEFMQQLGGPIMLKAVAGGGGRGMRAVMRPDELASAYRRCSSEALTAFGKGDVYVEQLITGARHIEVQIVGDGSGAVQHLFERDCTLQRRHQKLLEIAPSPFIGAELRERLTSDACRLAASLNYRGLGTVEFLVDGDSGRYIFIECNPRLQVEHTVTEAITGLDLVALQFALAQGVSLGELGLTQAPRLPQMFAIQARVNMESMQADAQAFPTGGTLSAFEPPSGPGVRVDTFGYTGYETTGNFDSLLAKVIVSGPTRLEVLCAKADRALTEFRIAGVETNMDYLRALLQDPQLLRGQVDTTYVERCSAQLHAAAAKLADERSRRLGSPAVATAQAISSEPEVPAGAYAVRAPMRGKLIFVETDADRLQACGASVAVLEAMKLEHSVGTAQGGRFVARAGLLGEVVAAGALLGWVLPDAAADALTQALEQSDPDHIRADLAQVQHRKQGLLDAARPEAVAKRRRHGKNTARENLEHLLDAGSFVEYGGLTLAMQRSRRSEEELLRLSPADGTLTGLGTVNGQWFGADRARCAVMAYDYTVFAGTQGFMAHRKMDRIVHTCERLGVPFILFAEGGGGRPGDTDYVGVSGLEFTTFAHMARLSGKVPTIGIVSGRCFAGNAALLGCCDVIIATQDASIGMAGPAMIDGGGLGQVHADEVGPVEVQTKNGVIDLVARDETAAIELAKTYLGFVQGRVEPGLAADQRRLRAMVPENRVKGYDVRQVVHTLFDEASFMELREHFGRSVVTGFARLQGQAVGVIANDGSHLGGALDSNSADKISRFLELCDSYGLPVVSLCDTPGFMVGPESEKTAAVRHFARIFVTASHIKVPVLAIILRKAYGLGAQAMLGGNSLAPVATVAWPTGELGPMGIDGAVRLAYRRELEALEDPAEKDAFFKARTDEIYAQGKALNVASYNEIDDVIDPAQTREWLLAMLARLPPAQPGRAASGVSPW
ncbi:MAG: ATP-grasp domain-containing protein [Delftia acidovorans]|nr:ATP-grasp domain-containing protein [Delftia acidovorans]